METSDFVMIGAALCSSTISGVLGMGGGTFLQGIMTLFYPPSMIIPIHGVAQMGSNLSRATLSFKHVALPIVGIFACGSFCGALLGGPLVVTIPEKTYKIVMGCFLILVTWMPKFKQAPSVKSGKYFFVGVGGTFLALFVGAVGPLLAPFFLKDGMSKHELVATKAACQVFQHLFKIITFGLLGFAFQDHAVTLVGMLTAVIVGSYIGKKLLGRISEKWFVMAVKILITGLALRMIVKAFV